MRTIPTRLLIASLFVCGMTQVKPVLTEEAIGEYRAFLGTNPERGIGAQVEERIRQLQKGP